MRPRRFAAAPVPNFVKIMRAQSARLSRRLVVLSARGRHSGKGFRPARGFPMRIRLLSLAAFLMLFAAPVLAADTAKSDVKGLYLLTDYPAVTVQPGTTSTISLRLRNYGLAPERLALSVAGVPAGWKATLLGGGQPVAAAMPATDDSVSLDLRLDVPKDAEMGTTTLTVNAEGASGTRVSLPIAVSLAKDLPAKLSLQTDLPQLRGASNSNFEYTLTIKNDSGKKLLVSLAANAPQNFDTSFTEAYGTQQLTAIPVDAGKTKDVKLKVTPPSTADAGTYPVTVRVAAEGAEATTKVELTITGEPKLEVSGRQGLLSAQATAGKESTIPITVSNTGTAPAENVKLSGTAPSGWKISFDPKVIDRIAPNERKEVQATIQPPEKAIAGDYATTITAASRGETGSANFRITVTTSTMWGIAGVGIIGVALLILLGAVVRFGRLSVRHVRERHRGPGADQALRAGDGRRSRQFQRRGRRDFRAARPQRRGQDHDHPDAARPHREQRGDGARIRPRSDARAARGQEARRLHAGTRRLLRPPHRGRQSLLYRAAHRHSRGRTRRSYRRGARPRRAGRGGGETGGRLFARHAPAAGACRDRHEECPRRHPRRTDQRARSAGGGGTARPHPFAQGERRQHPALVASAGPRPERLRPGGAVQQGSDRAHRHGGRARPPGAGRRLRGRGGGRRRDRHCAASRLAAGRAQRRGAGGRTLAPHLRPRSACRGGGRSGGGGRPAHATGARRAESRNHLHALFPEHAAGGGACGVKVRPGRGSASFCSRSSPIISPARACACWNGWWCWWHLRPSTRRSRRSAT